MVSFKEIRELLLLSLENKTVYAKYSHPKCVFSSSTFLFGYPFSNLRILIINYLKICETEALLLLTAAANQYCYFFTIIVEDD